MREQPNKFYCHSRMSIRQFDKLLELITPNLTTRKDDNFPVPPAMKLVVALRLTNIIFLQHFVHFIYIYSFFKSKTILVFYIQSKNKYKYYFNVLNFFCKYIC